MQRDPLDALISPPPPFSVSLSSSSSSSSTMTSSSSSASSVVQADIRPWKPDSSFGRALVPFFSTPPPLPVACDDAAIQDRDRRTETRERGSNEHTDDTRVVPVRGGGILQLSEDLANLLKQGHEKAKIESKSSTSTSKSSSTQRKKKIGERKALQEAKGFLTEEDIALSFAVHALSTREATMIAPASTMYVAFIRTFSHSYPCVLVHEIVVLTKSVSIVRGVLGMRCSYVSTSKPETRTPPDNADDSSRFAAGSYAMSPDPKTIPLPSFLNAYLRPDSVKKS